MSEEFIRVLQGLSVSLHFGLMHVPAALGFFIALRCLRFPDLTVEGSFVFGQVVSAAFLYDSPSGGTAALIFATLGGGICGLITAFQNQVLKVPSFVCGIVTTFFVTSINYKLLFLAQRHIFSSAEQPAYPTDMQLPSNGIFEWAVQADRASVTVGEYRLYELMEVAVITLVVVVAVFLFLRSKTGLRLRAFGLHRRSGEVYSTQSSTAVYGGLFLSNALVGFSGALCAQANRLSSIERGANLLIPLLAAIVLGEFFVAEIWDKPLKKLFCQSKESTCQTPLVSRPLALTLSPCVGFVIYQVMFILIAVVVLPDFTTLSMQSKYWMTATLILFIFIYRHLTGRAGEPEDVI